MFGKPGRDHRPSRPLRVVALAALFTFGCTVVRAPATGMDEVIPVREGRVEPQLALWVEGGSPVTPEQSQDAASRARAALSEAAQALTAPEDGLLVVRAQGVTRTGQRKGNQTAAVAGMVIGIVVIVAVVVVLVVAGGKGGGGHGGGTPSFHAAPGSAGAAAKGAGAAAKGAGTAAHAGGSVAHAATAGAKAGSVAHAAGGFRPAPLPRPGRAPSFRPAPPPRTVPYAPVPYPAPYPHGGVVVYGGFDVDIWTPWYPCCGYYGPYPYPATTTETTTVWTAPPTATDVAPYAPALAVESEAGPYDEEQEEAEPPPPLEQIALGPMNPLPLETRGFFDGDDLVVELVVVDRITGEAKLRKIARRAVDPCDVKAVRKLLEDTVKKGPWERLQPASS